MAETEGSAMDIYKPEGGGGESGRGGLSRRQTQVLELIRETVAERGYPPTVREIGEELGLRSPSTVHSHLSALEKAGAIRRDSTKPRAIAVVGVDWEEAGAERSEPGREVPLVGRIAAGGPILAEENLESVMTLPESLVGSGELFMLEVRGDSMTGAGILDGDLVVVRSQPDVEDGDIAAFLVNGEEATVKRLERREGRVVLHSENPDYPPMDFADGVESLGRVVTVLRALRPGRPRRRSP